MIDFIKENKVHFLAYVVSALFGLVGVSFGIYEYINKPICETIKDDNPLSVVTSKDVVEKPESFYIEIKGAVKKAGVYEVTNDMIINDVVKLAGGVNKNAYTDNINLSKKVSSEMVIYIYTKTQYNKLNIKIDESKQADSTCSTNTVIIDECIQNGNSVIVQGSTNPINEEKNENSSTIIDASKTSLVNINTANKEELMNLSGIGESKANNIINYRTENGLFKSIEEIKNVSGIGESIYEQIKANITV